MDVVVSAPGKVLITGGDLILEQPNLGLVLTTSARFFAIVNPINTTPASDSWAWSWTDVKVSSPQLFKETTYKLSLRDFTLKQIEAQSLPVTAKTLASPSEFSAITLNPFDPSSQMINGISLPEVAKTGLGSSAAMTSAVVAAILEYLGSVKIPLHGGQKGNSLDRAWNVDLVHSVAQAAHSAAQGKIGSGFDVSAAVYGGQCYIRFSPSVLSTKETGKIKSPLNKVEQLLQQKWDGERTKYPLPPQLLLWEKAGETHTEDKEIVEALLETRNAFVHVRSGLHYIGEKAKVPIEPRIQTELLNQTMKIPGVLLAGVPGAGGYDAVFAITLGESARDLVEEEWNREGMLTLPTKEDPCGVSLEDADPRTSHVGVALHAMSIH